jgi:hypothetical protein
MAEPFDSPLDVEALVPPTSIPGAWHMAVAVGMAAFALLMLNAQALASWTGALPPQPRNLAADAAAQGLAAHTAARGMDRPHAVIKQGWDRAKAMRWPEPAPDQRKKS